MQKGNEKQTVFRVKQEEELMPFLMRMMSGISRNKLKSILSNKLVQVDGKVCSQYNYLLREGMSVAVSKQSPLRNFHNPYVRIVFEDKYLIVVEKREGILTNGPAVAKETVQTVLNRYFRQSNQRCSAHVVHRLDRETSGLLVFAKDKKTELIFEEDWKGYVTDRRYVAVVSGVLENPQGTVRSWLKDNKAYVTYSSPTDNGGKLAITHYKTLRHTDDFSLVELKLDTGRKNQIRVHMQDLGHPVVGDPKYGGVPSAMNRMALHAYRLCFTHPVTHEELKFETDMPSSFHKLV
ncbi:MAG: RluA family pseudouridine synthase [Bacteroidales bacterium]|nr:RluA family pseudouridine synthase [Bacteroidales bacterium]MBP5134733.1 RluA family pseudouridine synthase [Paludibacteraceae bacterium]